MKIEIDFKNNGVRAVAILWAALLVFALCFVIAPIVTLVVVMLATLGLCMAAILWGLSSAIYEAFK